MSFSQPLVDQSESNLIPPICLNGKARDQKKNILGAARLKKKRKNPPSSLPTNTLQCNVGNGEILFFGAFSKNAP